MENLQPNISSLYGLNTAKEKVFFLAQTMSQFVRAQGHVREKKTNKKLLNLIKNSKIFYPGRIFLRQRFWLIRNALI